MNLLDRLLQHDAWTTRQLLLRSEHLASAQLDREFDIGRGSLRETFVHIIRNMEVWTDLMTGRDVRGAGGETITLLIDRLESASSDLTALANEIDRNDGWDNRWVDMLDDPPADKSFGGAIAHVITHGMHHRAQVLFMLRKLGVQNVPEGDVLSWERAVSDEASSDQEHRS